MAWFLLGELMYERNRCSEAIEAYKNAVKFAEGRSFNEAEYRTAKCLYKSGRKDEADEVLKRLSGEEGDPFWGNLSGGALEDMDWQKGYDRP